MSIKTNTEFLEFIKSRRSIRNFIYQKIDKDIRVCPYCGSILKNKKNYEENLDYIRAYINDVGDTQNQIIHELEQYIKRLVRIIKTLKLKLGYQICPRCNGEGLTE